MQEMVGLVIIASVFSAWTLGNLCALICDNYKVFLKNELLNNMFCACLALGQIINRMLKALGFFEKKILCNSSREEC